jgi:hypothetical protein
MYGISSRGKPERCGPAALGLGGRLTTPRRKKKTVCYEMLRGS